MTKFRITNSNNCQEPPCATVYFCAVCDEEDATINRQVWVEPGMELELFTYGYWNLNLNIYLGGSLIAEINNSYSTETINHTITSSGQMMLTIVSEYNYLGSGKIVVLEMLSTTCGTCLMYTSGTENSYQMYGPSGLDVAEFIGLEVNSTTTDNDILNFISIF